MRIDLCVNTYLLDWWDKSIVVTKRGRLQEYIPQANPEHDTDAYKARTTYISSVDNTFGQDKDALTR